MLILCTLNYISAFLGSRLPARYVRYDFWWFLIWFAVLLIILGPILLAFISATLTGRCVEIHFLRFTGLFELSIIDVKYQCGRR